MKNLGFNIMWEIGWFLLPFFALTFCELGAKTALCIAIITYLTHLRIAELLDKITQNQ